MIEHQVFAEATVSARLLKPGERKRLMKEIKEVISSYNFEQDVLDQFISHLTFPRRGGGAQSVDVMEMWCGTMPFTIRCARFGLVAMEPGDLWSGWDYTLKADQQLVYYAMDRHRPRLMACGIECTPWWWWNVHVNYVDRLELLKTMQEKAVCFLILMEGIFQRQLLRDDDAFVENPHHSSIWDYRVTKRMVKMRVRQGNKEVGLVLRTMDLCFWGKTDSKGRPLKKTMKFLCIFRLAIYMYGKCKCRVPHGSAQGEEIRVSMVYPDNLVDHICRAIL